MKKYRIFFYLLFIVFASCKKDNTEGNIAADQEFTTCNCSVAEPSKQLPDEYIKGNINGVEVCADIKGFFQDSFDNMLLYGTIKRSTGNTYYDNVHLIRNTKDGKFRFAIYLENTHLLTKQFPYELPRANPEICEIGGFELENLNKTTANMCMFCTNNNWHYYGPFLQNRIKFIADKYENGFFEGHFEGLILTGSGREATFKDGRFRIRLNIIQRDIIIP
jgi:hypothetical protein